MQRKVGGKYVLYSKKKGKDGKRKKLGEAATKEGIEKREREVQFFKHKRKTKKKKKRTKKR